MREECLRWPSVIDENMFGTIGRFRITIQGAGRERIGGRE
jgi:hypothetical protein